MNDSKQIFLVAQKNPDVDNPKETDLYSFGTIAEVLQLLKLPDGTVKILVEGKYISKIKEFNANDKFFLLWNFQRTAVPKTSQKLPGRISSPLILVLRGSSASL